MKNKFTENFPGGNIKKIELLGTGAEIGAALYDAFKSVKPASLQKWLEAPPDQLGEWPVEESFMPVEVASIQPDRIDLVTPTKARKLVICRIAEGIHATIEFGEMGSVWCAKEVARWCGNRDVEYALGAVLVAQEAVAMATEKKWREGHNHAVESPFLSMSESPTITNKEWWDNWKLMPPAVPAWRSAPGK
jgi:hypothetical protein